MRRRRKKKNEVFGVYIRGFRTKNGAEGAGKFGPKSSKILRFCPNPVNPPFLNARFSRRGGGFGSKLS